MLGRICDKDAALAKMSPITRRVLMVPKDANVQVNLILLLCFTSIPRLFHVLRDNQDQIYLVHLDLHLLLSFPPEQDQLLRLNVAFLFISFFGGEAFHQEDSDLCPGHQRLSAAVSFTGPLF